MEKEKKMKNMPSRDITGNCSGECRDRVFEGESERQATINKCDVEYEAPAERSPSWTNQRNETPGALGGRV